MQQAGQVDELVHCYFNAAHRMFSVLQGVAYLIDQAVPDRMTLAGCYACADQPPAELAMGEGLLGQCAVEKKSLVLDTATAGFATIRSGLGEIAPAALLLAPVPVVAPLYVVVAVTYAASLVFAHAAARTAAAHGGVTVGPYEIEVAWRIEPAAVGVANAVQVSITESATLRPVTDVAAVMKRRIDSCGPPRRERKEAAMLPFARSAPRCRHLRVTAKYSPSRLPTAYGPAPTTLPGGSPRRFPSPARRSPPLPARLSRRMGLRELSGRSQTRRRRKSN